MILTKLWFYEIVTFIMNVDVVTTAPDMLSNTFYAVVLVARSITAEHPE